MVILAEVLAHQPQDAIEGSRVERVLKAGREPDMGSQLLEPAVRSGVLVAEHLDEVRAALVVHHVDDEERDLVGTAAVGPGLQDARQPDAPTGASSRWV